MALSGLVGAWEGKGCTQEYEQMTKRRAWQMAKTCLLGSNLLSHAKRLLVFGRLARACDGRSGGRTVNKWRCDKRARIIRGGIKCVVVSKCQVYKVGLLGRKGSKDRHSRTTGIELSINFICAWLKIEVGGFSVVLVMAPSTFFLFLIAKQRRK